MNPHKDKFDKRIWFNSEKQYNELINALEGNEKDKISDIMLKVFFDEGFE